MRLKNGFTLVEMIVVITLMALILSIILPNYLNSIEKNKEVVLNQNLSSLRLSIDQYYSDNGNYPSDLKILIEKKYIRNIPVDPTTENNSWDIIYYEENQNLGIYDVKSKNSSESSKGTLYSQW
ncbi:type II secretion system protein [Acinetobacter bereziniae]|uniref:type II secretion system protein n=1 Tax=Acinetobacter bereziniae TaxID=106648 RepID=UPI001900D1FE|nr:prepilin-type N-terminal cleavage/methylation domain-containing protein [Acinetobacter bereziniae]MBJ8553299.1 prepilin-type N-terminal cleavage/methylation domain-containing protein [Acinetobacter bereziniae]